jgi:hypothetical protein
MTEAEIGRAVVTELQRQGYVTYEEVSAGLGGKRADVVGLRGRVLMLVECKRTLSLRLLDQLVTWRNAANYTVAAIEKGRVGEAVRRFAKSEGFGLWFVGASEIDETVAPQLVRQTDDRELRRFLHAAQRSGEYAKAGSIAGGYWTPFQDTVRQLKEVVKAEPGIELRAALDKIRHHYASSRSAMSAIPDLIKRGVITGMTASGRPFRLNAHLAPLLTQEEKPC